MTSPRDDDWRGLSERRLAGERLSEREEAQLAAARERDPACAAELELLDELAGLLDRSADAKDPVTIAIARAALARAAESPEPRGAPRRAATVGRWSIAGIAAVAAVAIAWWAMPPSPPELPAESFATARLVLATGDVYVDGTPTTAKNVELGLESTIAVQSGRACFAIDGGIDVCLAADTTATLHGLDGSRPWVEVRRGYAAARLDEQTHGRSFALGDAQMRATAVGTIFSLSAKSPSRTSAAVLRGLVDVDVAGQRLRLSAQEAAWIENGVVGRGSVPAEDEALALELLAPLQQLRGGDGGHLAIVASPSGVPVRVDGVDVGRSPVLVGLAVGQHRVEIGNGAVAESVHVGAGEIVERRFDLPSAAIPEPEPEPAPEPSPSPVVPAEVDLPTPVASAEPQVEPASAPAPRIASAAKMLADARELRRLDRWHDAARAYRDLLDAHPRSSEAETAWVSLGDLQLDRLRKPSAAARSYGRYLATGSTALAAEARHGRVRAYRALGDVAREIEAIEAYPRHHDATVRAKALRERLEQLRGAGR